MAQWKKGQSGNPGGRPAVVKELRELAREHTVEAVNTLLAVMQDDEAPAAARVSAACAMLDRGYGRPVQAVMAEIDAEIRVDDTTPLERTKRIAFLFASAQREAESKCLECDNTSIIN